MDFQIVTQGDNYNTVICTIATDTVIEEGDVCELSSGLPIKGTDSAAKLAFSPFGSANGDTQIELTKGNDFVLEGTGDAVFAVSQKGTEVDLVVTSTVQLIDVGSSSTNVFVVDISENAGTVDSASGIRVKINDGYQLF